MNIKIEPRKPTDRGGYICMPLKKNVPEGHKDWRLVECPVCGRECWQSYLVRKAEAFSGAIPLCTECALREGAGK